MTAKYFKYHVMMVHNNEQIPCDKCGKLFSRFGLKAHRATTCSDDGMVACEHCGKTMRAHLLKVMDKHHHKMSMVAFSIQNFLLTIAGSHFQSTFNKDCEMSILSKGVH